MWDLLASATGLSNDDVKTIGAIATTVGVLIALFEPRLARWWRAPLLTLRYENAQGGPHWDRVLVQENVFFLRLRVSNAPGCRSAEDTQAFVTSYKGGELGLDTRALEWSGQRPTPQSDAVTKLQIPPNVQRHVDLLQIKAGKDQLTPPDSAVEGGSVTDAAPAAASDGERGALVAYLCVAPRPWGAAHIVPPHDHDLKITLTANDVDAVTYKLTVGHRGGVNAWLVNGPTIENEPLGRRFQRWCKHRRHEYVG